MNGKTRAGRSARGFSCLVDQLDDRVLLHAPALISPLSVNPIAYPAVSPNRPIMPYGTPAKIASYIDPTVSIEHGDSVVLGYQDFIGPYATLDGSGGAIKIGNGSDVLDNASITATGGRGRHASEVLIGNSVVIGFGAKIIGPSTIGSYAGSTEPVSIGANALIDGATIEPGSIVSPLARVGPGVTVPTGYEVLPGVNVTTDAEASNPKLGMVVRVTASGLATIAKTLSENKSLAAGYTTLYQGNSATGASPGANPALSGIYSGDLAAILGASQQPGPTSASFEPAKSAPEFLSPRQGLVASVLSNFPARITGGVQIDMPASLAAARMGRANSIRADQGQPIAIGSIAHTGFRVTINSPLGGQISIGQAFRAGDGSVILSGPGVDSKLGDNVKIGAGAVVVQSSLGSDSTVGQGAYLMNSTFPANTVIPPSAIYINNKFEGYVQW